MEREEVKSKIKTKKRPKCEKMITPEVDVRSKADSKHKLMEKLADTPFFEHIDVWYRCSCGYRWHQTYANGNLISEIK